MLSDANRRPPEASLYSVAPSLYCGRGLVSRSAGLTSARIDKISDDDTAAYKINTFLCVIISKQVAYLLETAAPGCMSCAIIDIGYN